MRGMEDTARWWLIKKARKEYWRVATWLEFEDLIQDGHLHYQRLLAKYPDVTDRPLLMHLFKTTFTNHIHDLSKQRSKQSLEQLEELDKRRPRKRKSRESYDWDHDPLDKDETCGDHELAMFRVFLSKAPKPVQDVIGLLTHEGGSQAVRAQYRRRRDGTRETVNERLCRLCGYDPDAIDLAWLVREYLDPDSIHAGWLTRAYASFA